MALHPSPSEIVPQELDLTQSQVLNSGQPQPSDLPELVPQQVFGDYRIIQRLRLRNRRDRGSPDHRSDIYAIGVTLYYLVTGEVPFAADAAKAFEEIRDDYPEVAQMMSPSVAPRHAILWGTVSWLELIWLPSLFTAILFRGGLLLRIFGLTLANRHGQPASRIRVFIRMFASGFVPVALIVFFLALPAWTAGHWHFEDTSRYIATSLIITACLAVVVYRSGRRLFGDRVAGTYLVAR